MDNSPSIIGAMLVGVVTATASMMLFRGAYPGSGALWFVMGYVGGGLTAWLVARLASSTPMAWSRVLKLLAYCLYLMPFVVVHKIATQPPPAKFPAFNTTYYDTIIDFVILLVGCYIPGFYCSCLSRRFAYLANGLLPDIRSLD